MIGYRVPPNVSFEHGIAPCGQRILAGMTSAQILFSLSLVAAASAQTEAFESPKHWSIANPIWAMEFRRSTCLISHLVRREASKT